jgi:hypothetical protein
MRFGGRVIGAIFSESIGPRARSHPVAHGDPVLLALCAAYVILLLPLAFSVGPGHLVLAPFVLLLSLLIWREVRIDVGEAVPKVDFARLRFLVHDVASIVRYTAFVILVLLLFVDFAAFAFAYSWRLTALAAFVAFVALNLASIRMMRAIVRPPARMLASDLLSRAELEGRRRTRHRRDQRSFAPKDL